jgi:hypothetical protein
MAAPEEFIDLDLNCRACGCGLRLHCSDWRSGGETKRATFACPRCRQENVVDMPATLERVMARTPMR